MLVNKAKCLYFFLAVFSFICQCAFGKEKSATVVRATLDIGSGATELRIAEVNLKKQKIKRVLASRAFAIHYQQQLSKSTDGNFDAKIMEEGIEALKEAAKLAKEYHAEKVIAVATEAFRAAGNADEYINNIYKETGIQVYVIDQDLEGQLAFQAARSHLKVPSSELLVWDIGGGSLQLTSLDSDGNYQIYKGLDASVSFKNYVLESIQHHNLMKVNSPNPMAFSEIMHAQFYARRLAKKVDSIFKAKIKNPNTTIVGVGKIFGYRIAKIGSEKEAISRDEMVAEVASLVNKSDEDIGKGSYTDVYVTNAILILGLMEGLNIQKMKIADINPADGAFFYSAFWEKVNPQNSFASIHE